MSIRSAGALALGPAGASAVFLTMLALAETHPVTILGGALATMAFGCWLFRRLNWL